MILPPLFVPVSDGCMRFRGDAYRDVCVWKLTGVYPSISLNNHAFDLFAQLYVELVIYQKKLSWVLVCNVQRLQRNDR